MSKRIAFAPLAIALAALLGLTAACEPSAPLDHDRADDPASTSRATAAPSTNDPGSLVPAPTPAPTFTTASELVTTPTPNLSPTASSSNGTLIPPPRLTPDSVDQYIFSADVIVRASLLSAAAAVEGAGTAFRPVSNLRFRAIEYLKGTGAAEFTVRVSPPAYEDAYGTREEAQRASEAQLASRNSAWDDREGALFLKAAGVSGAASASTNTFNFVWRATNSPLDYTIDTIARTWLPAATAHGARGQSDADVRYLTSADGAQAGGASGSAGATSVSLADLRSQIAAMDALLERGAGIEGYRDCVASQLGAGTSRREYEAQTGNKWVPHTFRHSIESGLAAGVSMFSQPEEYTYAQSPRYDRLWLEGTDKAHFTVAVLDDDEDPQNGWYYYARTNRPLPAGTYLTEFHAEFWYHMPCNFDANSYVFNRLVVTAPPGTVHEAFFDPVTIGSAIGADGANGALEPAAFTANGTSTALQSLQWSNSGTITLTLSPNASLSGLALDFIALNGSVALTLPASAAKTDSPPGTLKWSSLAAPWNDGDKLMLRIRNAAATTPTAPTPTATATPTPTPIPTATPTPTATATPTATPTPPPDAPPGSVSGQ